MIRLPAALAIFALLSPSTALAEPCTPRVELTGDRDAVERVAVELEALGVVLGPIQPAERSCSVTAMVTVEGEGLSVAVQNAAKRSEGRVVSEPTIAAAWIDSWLRDEIEVASWVIAMPPAPPPVTAATPIDIGTSYATTAPATSLLDRFGLSAAVERSWTDDETTWNGFDLAGCVRVGAVCLGGRVRAVFQDNLDYNNTLAHRSDIVALATASIPFSVGQVSIAPELGLGVGRMRTKHVAACTAPPPSMDSPEPNTPGCSDPMDPSCQTMPDDPTTGPSGGQCYDASGQPTMEQYVGDSYDQVTYLPRVAAGVRFAFPIVRHVWLDAIAAFTLSPIKRSHDPETMVTNPTVVMPPEPTHGYQLGVGIRVGIP